MDMIEGIFRMRPGLCPLCGKLLDAVGKLEDGASGPTPGDVTLCMGCGALLSFADDMGLQVQDEGELDAETRREVERVRAAIVEVNASK
jgi:hypothetical protein